MTRRTGVQAVMLAATLLVTVPPLARLARGRTPSLLVTANVPFWERTPPRPRPLLGKRRITPAPPGSVRFTDPAVRALLFHVNEDALLRPLEHPDADPHDDASRAGRWLFAACAMGRADPILRGRQDRVASRLLGSQLSEGWFGKDPGVRKRRPSDWNAQAWCLRGLLAFYAVTHSPAAIDGASSCAGGVLRAPAPFSAPPELTLPMALLFRQTGDAGLLRWCERHAALGWCDPIGLCALYEATGKRAFLTQAAQLWARGVHSAHADREAAAGLWTETGDVRYLPALRENGGLALCPLSPGTLAYGRIPRGIAVRVWTNSVATFGTVRLSQMETVNKDGSRRVTLTVHVPRPTAFLLLVPPCGPSALFNGKPIAFAGTLLRRWRDGDGLTVTPVLAGGMKPPAGER